MVFLFFFYFHCIFTNCCLGLPFLKKCILYNTTCLRQLGHLFRRRLFNEILPLICSTPPLPTFIADPDRCMKEIF